ncbi:MAG: hypothetical protein ACJAWY_001396, partial [Sphingomonas echinoides]
MATESMAETEQIEGLQRDPAPEEISAYPLDDIMVRKDARTVRDVVQRIDAGRYSMNPDFQRDFVWSPDKQSKLIESCVMRIPLPVLYVAEGDDGRITVVDGLQRLGSGLIGHSQKMTVAASAMAEKKTRGPFST